MTQRKVTPRAKKLVPEEEVVSRVLAEETAEAVPETVPEAAGDMPAEAVPEDAGPAAPARYSRAELRAIVGVPKVKGQVPTLVRFRPNGQIPVHTVIVDIGEPILKAGWEYYSRTVPDASPDRYLQEVYSITSSDVPRLYKVVAELRLNC